VTVLSCPTPYDGFNVAAWWQSREDAKRVVSEYMKLANFYMVEIQRKLESNSLNQCGSLV